MAEISKPEINIEKVIARMREGAARRNIARRSGTEQAAFGSMDLHSSLFTDQYDASSDGSQESPQLVLQPEFHPHANNRYQVNDLLKFHDREFIQNAFRAILKRGPDNTGYKNFIEALRSGRLNKIDVLARLRYSSEGRAKKVEVEGLLLPALVRSAYRIPLIGYLFHLLVALARLPSMLRSQQQLESHLIAQQQQIADYSNHLNKSLQAYVSSITQRQQEQSAALKELSAHLKQFEHNLNERLAEEEARWQSERSALEKRFREESAEQREHHEHLVKNTWARVEQLNQESRTRIEHLSKELREQVERTFQKQQEVRAELALQGQRVQRLLGEAEHALAPTSINQTQLEAIRAEAEHTLDAFYMALEEKFRGSTEEIKERLRIYLPFIKEAGVGTKESPVLDVGAGRGEWLELLKEEGFTARGVDLNRTLVAECRERGLDVVEEDLIAHLRRLKDESIGALTGFHIVEHLPIETLIEFLNEALRVVKRGGLVIFETPNPQNVLVGSCNFYFDPTHRNPLPPQILQFMVESRGFTGVEVIKLNPSDAERVEGNSDLVKRFNEYFYGAMDYAVVGRKV